MLIIDINFLPSNHRQLGDRSLPTLGSTISLTTVDKTSIVKALAVGDYNGDGYDDVVLRTSNGVWTLYHGSLSGTLNSTSTTFSGLTGNALGDINGDGYSDVGLGNQNKNLISPNTLGNGEFTIYQGNNQGNSVIDPPDAVLEQALINSEWRSQYSLGGQSTDLAPTLIEFNGYLYMLYNGTDSDTLWMQRSSDGVNWEGLTNLGSSFETDYQASLAVFNNTLYLAFTATDNELILASAVSADSDLGLTFSGGDFYQIPGQNSKQGPTLVSYNDQLYTFFLANNSNNSILYVSSDNPADSNTWSANSNVPYDGGNNSSSDRIGVTVFNDELYIAFKADNSNSISVTSYDGSSWSSANSSATSQVIPNQGTSAGPSLIATNETLYLFFQSGNSDGETIFYMSGEGLGENWTSDNAFIPNQSSSDRTSPAFFNQSIYIAHVGNVNDDSIYVTASNPIFEPNQTQQLGAQLQGIGDFNGDGIEDYGVLASGYATFGEFNGSDFNNNQGGLFIYYGSTSGTFNSNPDVVLNPNYSTNPNGVSELSNFTAIGDANGDGYDDVVMASPTTALTSNDTEDGTVFVVFGGKTWGNPLTDEFHLNVDPSDGQIRNWNHIKGVQPHSVMGGKLEFRVTTTDGKGEVKLYFEGSEDFNNYYLFNNETQQYEPFKGAKLFDENADGKYEGAILNLQDGSKYDVDGSENGIIFKRGFFANGESPEVILDTAMYRFRSLNTQGAYLYVGAEEKESVWRRD